MIIMNIKSKIKRSRYIECIFRYGITPVLLLLQECENNENYEECQIILSAIEYINKNTDGIVIEVLPTKYNPEIIVNLKKEFKKLGLTGNIAINNIPNYIEEIKNYVKLKK